MAKSKKIVIWDGEDILSSSIKLFLAAREDWQVVSISSSEDLETLKLVVETTQPDIVIIRQGCQNGPPNLPVQLLQDHPAIKVITLGLEDNLMEIYCKQKILVKHASDLIAVIENGP